MSVDGECEAIFRDCIGYKPVKGCLCEEIKRGRTELFCPKHLTGLKAKLDQYNRRLFESFPYSADDICSGAHDAYIRYILAKRAFKSGPPKSMFVLFCLVISFITIDVLINSFIENIRSSNYILLILALQWILIVFVATCVLILISINKVAQLTGVVNSLKHHRRIFYIIGAYFTITTILAIILIIRNEDVMLQEIYDEPYVILIILIIQRLLSLVHYANVLYTIISLGDIRLFGGHEKYAEIRKAAFNNRKY